MPKPGTFNRYTAGSAWTNYSVTTELRSSDNDTLGVMFRYTNATNYYRFSMDSERAIRRLTKVRNGTWTSLWSDTTAYQLNRTYVLEIIANGSNITVKLDGVQLWSGNDTNTLTTGTVAMYSWMNTGAQFDNVLVRNLSVPFSSVAPSAPSFGEGLFDGFIGAVRAHWVAALTPRPKPAPPPESIRIAMLMPLHADNRSRSEGSAP